MTTPPSSSTEAPAFPPPDPARLRKQRLITAGVVLAALIILATTGFGVYYLGSHPTTAEVVRDISIIAAAIILIFIMLALSVLIVQLARLTNLLQHEIKPILDSTNETVNTVRGTAEFLSDNMVAPVMKLNSYLAGLQRMLDLLKPGGK